MVKHSERVEGNTLRDLVETHRELARESSVYEDVRVDVEELAALLDVAEAAGGLMDKVVPVAHPAVFELSSALARFREVTSEVVDRARWETRTAMHEGEHDEL